jgi:hypothetical protein
MIYLKTYILGIASVKKLANISVQNVFQTREINGGHDCPDMVYKWPVLGDTHHFSREAEGRKYSRR